ncbi:MAG: class I SAM-dependent methyltransferase [Deltaproteobacteria bacterium]|nr:class I SAM-dependent methyltransferase [Deltaproteobacteria bacterium]
MTLFAEPYARVYDCFQARKDYAREADLIEGVFRRCGGGSIERVLDVGCGTGGHALILARRGYRVTGLDQSVDMLRRAEAKAAAAGLAATWVNGDLRSFAVDGGFDAALVMYSTLGYMLENDDVLSALRNVRRHLRAGGLLLFDVWYGPAVLTIKPSDRTTVVEVSDGTVTRTVKVELDARHHRCAVQYHFRHQSGSLAAQESEELHLVRYFFPLELELMLGQTGFALAALTAFPEVDRPPDLDSWNVLGVARAA